jgi:MFS family permease
MTVSTFPTGTGEASRSLLRDGSFVRVCAGLTISAAGDQLFPIAVAVWILTQRGDGPAALGALFAVRAVATSLLLVVGGVFSDRLPPRLQMIGSQVVLCATVATLAILPRDAPLLVILVLFVVAGAGDAFFGPAYQTYLVDLAGPARLESANSASTLARRMAGLFGPALGGLLVATVGIHITLLVDAASFIVSAALVASTRRVQEEPTVRAPANARMLLREAYEGLSLTTRTRWIRAVLLSDLSQTFFAVAPWFVLLPIVLIPHGTTYYAVTLSAFAAGGLVGAATPLKWKPRAIGRAALLSQSLFVIPLVALAFDLPLPLIAVASIVGGFGADLGSVLFITGLQRGVPRQTLGRVMALTQIGSVALMPAGFALAGALVRPLGAEPILLTGVAVVVIATAAALRVPGVPHMAPPNNPPGSSGCVR